MDQYEEVDDSYDEIKLENLKKQIAVSKSQLLALAYNDQLFVKKLEELNQKGYECLNKQQFYESIVYLNEAEGVLEYAASCGKTIERTLIIATLHNEACVYQRIWQLPKSADYIEAIIYNISSFLNSESGIQLTPDLLNKNSAQYNRMCAYLGNKFHLISYNLQFCAVSSQIKNHENALNSASKALNLLKSYCEQLSAYEKFTGFSGLTEFQKGLLMQLQNIRNFMQEETEDIEKNVEKLMYKAKKSIVVFQKKMKFTNINLSQSELKQLQNFSIGQIMQISPVLVNKMQEKVDLKHQLSFIRKIYKSIYISIAHFTMATQLRLVANDRHGIDSSHKKNSKQFKQSQIHHLVAIITAALYVPCYTKYFQHILGSFKNHYQVDLTQNSDISLSQEASSHRQEDDLIHLETQSISQRDSSKIKRLQRDDINNSKQKEYAINQFESSLQFKGSQGYHTERLSNGRSFYRETMSLKTHQQPQSTQNSENQKIKNILSKTREQNEENNSKKIKKSKQKDKISFKKSNKEKSKEKRKIHQSPNIPVSLQKIQKSEEFHSRQNHLTKNKSKSKGKKSLSKSKGNTSFSHQKNSTQRENIVHSINYLQFDKKKLKKNQKVQGEQIVINNIIRTAKKQIKIGNLINRKSQALAQVHSTKNLINSQKMTMKYIKKHKSPDLNTSRSTTKLFKRH